MAQRLMTLRAAAAELGVAAHVLVYALVSGKAPEPLRIGGRRMFSPRDLERLRTVLGESRTERRGREGHVR